MKYCANCGTELPEGTTICRNCGQGVNLTKSPGGIQTNAAPSVHPGNAPAGGQQVGGTPDAPAWRQGAPPQQPFGAPPPNAPSGGSSGKTGLLIGCGVMLVIGIILLVVGGIGYYLYQKDEDKPIAPQQQEQRSGTPVQKKSEGRGNAEWNDLVREKDEIDIAIGEIANRANRHLNSYPDFRNASGLINDAKAVVDRARRAESRAAALEGLDPAGCNALRALLAVEVHRAQGLYKGMIDSANGGEYSYGFSEGTTASYAFDRANADFDRLYR